MAIIKKTHFKDPLFPLVWLLDDKVLPVLKFWCNSFSDWLRVLSTMISTDPMITEPLIKVQISHCLLLWMLTVNVSVTKKG